MGRSGVEELSRTRAVLWRGGTPIDLTTLVAAPDWILTSATAINDVGLIAGTGMHNGQARAFLLTPAFARAESERASARQADQTRR